MRAVEESLTGSLDRLAFYRRLAPVANRLNDEHTMVYPPGRDESVAVFPLGVAILEGRLWVSSAPPVDSGMRRGDELLSINGRDTRSIIETLSTYYSGTGLRQKHAYLEWDFANALSQVLGMRSPFRVRFRNAADDQMGTAELAGTSDVGPERQAFSYQRVSEKTLLFSYNAFDDEEGRFDDFLANLFQVATVEDIDALIIDLRRNQGGAAEFGDQVISYLTDQPFTQLTRVDVTVSDAVKEEFLSYVPGFLRWLPVQYMHPFLRPLWTNETGEIASIDFEPFAPDDALVRFNGDVYVLIGPGTMSSASLFAAAIKHYRLGTLVGENTGGFATMYGNIIDARLPNTGLKVWMPTSVVYGQGEGPVAPDHEVLLSVEDIAAGSDAVLEFTLDLVAERQNE